MGNLTFLNVQLVKVSLDPKKPQQEISMAQTKEANITGSQENKPKYQPEVDPSAGNPVSEVSSLKSLNIVRSSKFRHIEGKYKHRSSYITKIPSLSATVPGDCNAFQVE